MAIFQRKMKVSAPLPAKPDATKNVSVNECLHYFENMITFANNIVFNESGKNKANIAFNLIVDAYIEMAELAEDNPLVIKGMKHLLHSKVEGKALGNYFAKKEAVAGHTPYQAFLDVIVHEKDMEEVVANYREPLSVLQRITQSVNDIASHSVKATAKAASNMINTTVLFRNSIREMKSDSSQKTQVSHADNERDNALEFKK